MAAITTARLKRCAPVSQSYVDHSPLKVWAVLTGFYDVATRAERDRLDTITASTKILAFNNSDSTGARALFNMPEPVVLDWFADAPPNRRLSDARPGRRKLALAPPTEKLANLYGRLRPFRAALRARILPGSYSGSLEDHLRRFLTPLAAWATHPMLGSCTTSLLGDLDGGFVNETPSR